MTEEKIEVIYSDYTTTVGRSLNGFPIGIHIAYLRRIRFFHIDLFQMRSLRDHFYANWDDEEPDKYMEKFIRWFLNQTKDQIENLLALCELTK